MQYGIAFLEGMITFLSPCLLPMLPIYLSYFAGGGVRSVKKTFFGALGFVVGFTAIFVALGALAGTMGSVLQEYQTAVNLVTGLIVVYFGLSFLGVFRWTPFRGISRFTGTANPGFFSSLIFGVVFSVGWTPCVSAFLGSALALASQQGHVSEGVFMLLSYSLGLGVPFLLSALLIDSLKSAFHWIQQHYQLINTICGILLVLVGILMATGTLGRLLNLLG